MTGFWCGYLSGARCRLFAYNPAYAIVIPKSHHLLPHLNPDWFRGFTFLVPAYPGSPGKEAVKVVVVLKLFLECKAALHASNANAQMQHTVQLIVTDPSHSMLLLHNYEQVISRSQLRIQL